MNNNLDKPAFPVPKLSNGSGMTVYEWAGVLLRVPETGNVKLDEMIRRSHAMSSPSQILPMGINQEPSGINYIKS